MQLRATRQVKATSAPTRNEEVLLSDEKGTELRERSGGITKANPQIKVTPNF